MANSEPSVNDQIAAAARAAASSASERLSCNVRGAAGESAKTALLQFSVELQKAVEAAKLLP